MFVLPVRLRWTISCFASSDMIRSGRPSPSISLKAALVKLTPLDQDLVTLVVNLSFKNRICIGMETAKLPY